MSPLSGRNELCTECRKVRHFLIELYRQEVGVVFLGRGFRLRPQRIELCQHIVRDRETYSSWTVVLTLERAFNLDTCIICS